MHSLRVEGYVKKILNVENKAISDEEVVITQLAAILHDIGRIHKREEHAKIGRDIVYNWLKENSVILDRIKDPNRLLYLIERHSNKEEKDLDYCLNLLRDADILDEIGVMSVFMASNWIDKSNPYFFELLSDRVSNFEISFCDKGFKLLNTESAKLILNEKRRFIEILDKQLKNELCGTELLGEVNIEIYCLNLGGIILTSKVKKFDIKRAGKSKNSENSGVVLEAEKPLSQSMLWKLQTDFFANQGPEAWIKGVVPQYITTNPYIANLYAKTVFAYCRDYAAREDFDKNTTVYIMELASGVGRFTYTFLKRFLHIIENSSLKELKFKYIVTDLAERNIQYWQKHSFLKPYFESGVLDCATFDMAQDEEICLRNSGEVLRCGSLKNPLILFANYTFDSLPQDTFYVNKGKLFEGLITITSQGEKVDSEDKSILAGLDYYYTDKQIQGSDYYEDANFNNILLYYKECLEDTAFYLPITALRCIKRLKTLFNDNIILISADKGYKNEKSMHKNYHPYLSKHGCISMTVNFHALELYFKALGGKAIHSIYEHENINMSLFLLSQSTHDFIETAMAYNEIIESIGPDDFYIIKKGVVPLNKSLTTKELLTFLRFTVWDARTFLELYNALLERIEKEEDFPKDELIDAIYKVWEHYFPIGEEGDTAYCLGSLLAYFGYDSDALKLFKTSLEFYGEDAAIYYEIAACHYNLQQLEKAKEYTEKSLVLDPDFEQSKNLKSLILNFLV